MNEAVLSVEGLKVVFETKYGRANAINDISFSLRKGEKLGLVGESGSGKSVTSKAIMRLLASPPARVEGRILLDGEDLMQKSEKEMCKYRGNHISMIFQEPMVSLNPLFTIGDQLSEVIRTHKKASRKETEAEMLEILRVVGIPSPKARLKQYPFELSGGMRQRVMIAMALLCQPRVLIADEPTTALDVTIQAQILDLLNKLNREMGTAIVLITHDLGVIAEMADTVAVMYAGSIVEKAPVRDIFFRPLHPYTEGLLRSIPTMDEKEGELDTIEGSVPSLYNLPAGCAFYNRCPYASPECAAEEPPVLTVDSRSVKCWKYAGVGQKEVL
ncbi:MAG: dipeptide transport ATP-binding protein DppD [Paenibacillaceae bacterium]|jgi:peptide/nickel transport system ATP-binding protein/oligopeptide transport system ATP-binding protein|nr:dipeptide transport ATP-binding protein DppD [Paenibacillaceae bacterium]